ncbi:MAG TPA: hypothetical protein VKB28_15710 [Solirubrobacteraceae bacterium]|jgi:hypothetical protein|nr:hypothetical protein [Solirubrobacteraceae bacterium]
MPTPGANLSGVPGSADPTSEDPMNTRTIAIIALVIAVVVLIVLLT